MYENKTYEGILASLLDRVPIDIDKREGSLIYNALAPAAVELQNMYIQLDWILDQAFADTAKRPYLIKRCAERGIYPKQATKPVLKASFNINVPLESRFSMDTLNYTVIEKIEDNVYRLECETYGTEGNRNLGNIIPIEYIEGLTDAELTEVLIYGVDEESTEDLRQRYFDSLDSQAFGGNIADYKEKAKSIDGVGGVKVYPVWNGGGTVKLVIIDSAFNVPSNDILNNAQTQIDPTQNLGKGVGLAPIGHVVTLEKVTATPINITTTITYQEGWSFEDIKPSILKCIDDYYYDLAKTWEDNDNLVVRISHLETKLLGLDGILDIGDTRLNDSDKNLLLDPNNIPTRGDFNG